VKPFNKQDIMISGGVQQPVIFRKTKNGNNIELLGVIPRTVHTESSFLRHGKYCTHNELLHHHCCRWRRRR